MRKTVIPKLKNNCFVRVKIEYLFGAGETRSIKFKSYKPIKHRVGNTFLDRQWGPFHIRSIELLLYGPELPV